MDEEKSMIEYKEPKGLFQRIKSMFEKIKERFGFAQKTSKPQNIEPEELGLSEKELDKVTAGYPNPDVIDYDKQKDIIDKLEFKPWELSDEQLQKVNQGYEEIKREMQEEQELSEEELDDVKAGYPNELE